MGEHGAVPNSARRQRRRRNKSSTRPPDGARGGPNRADAADADQPGEQVADGVSIERNDFFQSNRNHVEQAAIQIEISEVKQGLIGEAAGIIGDNQFAIALLHFFVVGDGIIAKGEDDERNQRGEEYGCRQVVAIKVVAIKRRQNSHGSASETNSRSAIEVGQ